jgi:Ni/Fe-hydrogenase 1 B-type cytochrome subunit
MGEFPMATIRYYHFLAGYVFSSALLARIFLLLFGNTQERFWNFLPITGRNIKSLFNETLSYLYIKENPDHRLGHNALAGTTFFIIFILAALQVISGFYMLYPETLFWQKWGLTILGPQQKARFLHHLTMWGFLLFAFIHVYIVVWNDLKNGDGLISSIITGNKFRPKKV